MSEFKLILHHLIALKVFYNFGFECVDIGRNACPQTHENERGSADISGVSVVQREFAAKRLHQSIHTQKTFYRAFKELSNGIKLNQIQSKLTVIWIL